MEKTYLGEISALCLVNVPTALSPLPFLVAGSGSHLLVFDVYSNRLLHSFPVFEGVRVHGIAASPLPSAPNSPFPFIIVISGERLVKLFTLRFYLPSLPSSPDLSLLHLLPRFSHWVLDFRFLLDGSSSSGGDCRYLAVGCSDNSVRVWDTFSSTFILQVLCPERCLLYSMKLWGHHFDALLIASGTIFNEIVVWKLVRRLSERYLRSTGEDADMTTSFDDMRLSEGSCYEAEIVSRLSGHQGSIFCLSWSTDGSKLVSVSDDRSARMWISDTEINLTDGSRILHGPYSAGPMLFGHGARVWDCFISDSLIVTAGEDCTCRVWGLDGRELRVIKEHIGRGIWRCLYDPNSSLLVTAGFDSAIKVHSLSTSSLVESAESIEEVNERKAEVLKVCIPNSSGDIALMDSKSEYVRCLKFARQDTIYVATNHGYVYHAKLFESGSVEWTELINVTEEVPIICMDLLFRDFSEPALDIEDWVAVGDGRGAMKVIKVMIREGTPQVAARFSWVAEKERQLLGSYWCKSLGSGFIFTSNPRGLVKLWCMSRSLSDNVQRYCDAHLVADFTSPFGARIITLDASREEEVLVCGDLRGNLVLFPLSKSILVDAFPRASEKISSVTYFKGAHGISSVSSISLARYSCTVVEICSTGGDGCICYLEYNKSQQTLEFVGMRQTKELSLVQSISANHDSPDDSANISYAVGFSSTDFLIWNLVSKTKVLQVKCGGWRRPHSYYLGPVPEIYSSFAYVKDEVIYIHRYWIPDSEKKIFPRNLHLQFHGREIHSLCIIPEDLQCASNGMHFLNLKSSWVATGCEDGSVRLTRYNREATSWAMSNLLGEHVGGSAVRALCFVSKIHLAAAKMVEAINGTCETNNSSGKIDKPALLISVGAKRVLTSWLLRNRHMTKADASTLGLENRDAGLESSPGESSLLSFKWLSTDMPTKYIRSQKKTQGSENLTERSGAIPGTKSVSTDGEMELIQNRDTNDNDWRYLAVTAFLVSVVQSRLTVCFIVVACSDATLMLRALVLPYRYWFDVASLAPLSSPVLALQHAVNSLHFPYKGCTMTKNIYIVISGSTDGSIAFWDLTENVETFVQRVSLLHVEKSIDFQKRPRTGRGSQGGRWWKSVDSSVTAEIHTGVSVASNNDLVCSDNATNDSSRVSMNLEEDHKHCDYKGKASSVSEDASAQFYETKPLHVLHNVHQSGVNCLHLSCQNLGSSAKYSIVSGGDDQALNFLQVVVGPTQSRTNVDNTRKGDAICDSRSTECSTHCYSDQSYSIKFLHSNKTLSAHSSAVKGVWTDGIRVLSTGLDQRLRCWDLQEDVNLVECTHFITSVPEPEALDVRSCGRNCYQAVIAGRGMQIVEILFDEEGN